MGLLDGKVVLVTGGGRGIGRETAILAARQGAKVIVNDLGAAINGEGADVGPAQEVVDLIKAEGGEAVANTESVTDLRAVGHMVQQAMDTYGALHAVSNPAGILRDRMAHNMTEEEWDAIMTVHLRGHFNVVRATINHFRTQQDGVYVMWSSGSGLIGNVGQANYAAAKLGITALSKSIALDMQRYNVRSNCLSPWAWSRMTSSIPATTPEQKAAVEKLQRMTPDKNAPLAVFLASDAAKGITGQVFGTRMNEIYLFSSPRPIRIVHRAEGWTPETIAQHAIPAVQAAFMPLDTSEQAFPWDPV
jgi:NAD(P)-dependent dehydrogenase (short-subunit alcohol dehydrogenase family)